MIFQSYLHKNYILLDLLANKGIRLNVNLVALSILHIVIIVLKKRDYKLLEPLSLMLKLLSVHWPIKDY